MQTMFLICECFCSGGGMIMDPFRSGDLPTLPGSSTPPGQLPRYQSCDASGFTVTVLCNPPLHLNLR